MSIPNRSMVRVVDEGNEWHGCVGKMVGAVSFKYAHNEPVDVFAVVFAPGSKMGFEESKLEVVTIDNMRQPGTETE